MFSWKRDSFVGLVSVVVWLERSGFSEPHVLGLIVRKLRQVRVEGGQMETGHEFVHQLRHQVDVRLVAAGRGIVQLWKYLM